MDIDPELSKYIIDSKALEQNLAERASEIRVRHLHHRKKYIINGVEVEFVRPMDNSEFCAYCSRLRVTADGKFKPCLLVNNNLVDIRGARSPAEIEQLLRLAVSRRKPYYTHRFKIEEEENENRTFSGRQKNPNE